jgi:hypothetical protein
MQLMFTTGPNLYMERNSDGHQFHQYQPNKKAPLILAQPTERKKDPDM